VGTIPFRKDIHYRDRSKEPEIPLGAKDFHTLSAILAFKVNGV